MALNPDQNDDYLETPELRSCLGEINDALFNGKGLVYLKGPAGAGKTRMAHRLVQMLGNHFQVLEITVNPLMEIRSFLLDELDLKEPAAGETQWPPEELLGRIQGRRLLLILDDAHLLHKEDVRSVWSLAKIGVSVLFVGQGGFAGGLQLKNITETAVPVFSPEQCAAFLQSLGIRLPADVSLSTLYDDTGGIPGTLKKLASMRSWREKDVEPEPKSEPVPDEVQRASSSDAAVVAGVLLLLLLVTLAWSIWKYQWFWQPNEEAVPASVTQSIPTPPQKVPSVLTRVVDVQQAKHPDLDTRAMASSIVPESPAAPTALEQDREWLLSQDPRSFTLQVAGAWDERHLRKILASVKIEQPAAIFVRSRQNRSWYSLVVGVFPDLATATAANAEISKKFRVKDAWVRRFEDIQRLIKPGRDD